MQFQFNGVLYHFTNTQLILSRGCPHRRGSHRRWRLSGAPQSQDLGLSQAFRQRVRPRRSFPRLPAARPKPSWPTAKPACVALKIRDLGVTERDRFVAEWQHRPIPLRRSSQAAVTEADDLINALLEARGYPLAGFEQRADDLSVAYPRVMENYRLAHSPSAVRLGRQ
jgi:hypothetical protein